MYLFRCIYLAVHKLIYVLKKTTENDILKAYAYAVVSKRYSKEFNGIFEFDNLRNSSVEMTVSYSDPDDENSVDGFDIEALTCLGKTVNGSCPDADIKMRRPQSRASPPRL